MSGDGRPEGRRGHARGNMRCLARHQRRSALLRIGCYLHRQCRAMGRALTCMHMHPFGIAPEFGVPLMHMRCRIGVIEAGSIVDFDFRPGADEQHHDQGPQCQMPQMVLEDVHLHDLDSLSPSAAATVMQVNTVRKRGTDVLQQRTMAHTVSFAGTPHRTFAGSPFTFGHALPKRGSNDRLASAPQWCTEVPKQLDTTIKGHHQ